MAVKPCWKAGSSGKAGGSPSWRAAWFGLIAVAKFSDYFKFDERFESTDSD